VTTATGILQNFDATGNELYSVEMVIDSHASSTAYGKLQLSWTTPGESTSLIDIEINPITNLPRAYRMSSTAPLGATAGTIIVSGYGPEPVCVRSASIVRGTQAP
jgi:hypothetical protein